MGEKRIVPRHRVLEAGTIEFGGGGNDCTVRNLSETGAALEVVTPMLSLTTSGCLCRPSN
jgi:hypothetical protein